jgi:hypothetical protein
MFRDKTAFILGAGANRHYGYPTGDELVREVIVRAREAGDYFRDVAASNFAELIAQRPQIVARHDPARPAASNLDLNHLKEQWQAARDKCEELIERLTLAHPPLIDNFLTWNQDLQEIGKFMIAWVILECEAQQVASTQQLEWLAGNDSAPKNDWHRFILYRLVSGFNDPALLLANNVTFITLNYDVSLEIGLEAGLSSYAPFRPQIAAFFKKYEVLHLYGKVRDFPASQIVPLPVRILPTGTLSAWNEQALKQQQACIDAMNAIYDASQTIATACAREKGGKGDAIKLARDAIAGAEEIYILGYGFDDDNNERLALGELIGASRSDRPKRVYLTNFGEHNRVTKIASRLFGAPIVPQTPTIIGRKYFEMSTRDVYGAFERDFDYPGA